MKTPSSKKLIAVAAGLLPLLIGILKRRRR